MGLFTITDKKYIYKDENINKFNCTPGGIDESASIVLRSGLGLPPSSDI